MKIIKTMIGWSGLKYRILQFKDYFELQYKGKMFPGSLRNEWKYCGDYESMEDAEHYFDKRESLLVDGDTVML